MLRYFWITIFFLLATKFCFGQDTIKILNSSFENGQVGLYEVPNDWHTCGPQNQTPPDTHSRGTEISRVRHLPSDGERFIGMVTRANGSTECILQELIQPLVANQKYRFSIDLAHFQELRNRTGKRKKITIFKSPCVLRILGQNEGDTTAQFLAESPIVGHPNWRRYNFEIVPTETVNQLILMVYFPPETEEKDFSYGNLLLDNCSDLIPIN